MIDWSKPIELDTVPPRPARVQDVVNGDAWVAARWIVGGAEHARLADPTGATPCGLPRVRNVTTPTDDVTAELLATLKAIAEGSVDPAIWPDLAVRYEKFAQAALAKAEART